MIHAFIYFSPQLQISDFGSSLRKMTFPWDFLAADGILLVYDVTGKYALTDIHYLAENAGDIPLIMIGERITMSISFWVPHS